MCFLQGEIGQKVFLLIVNKFQPNHTLDEYSDKPAIITAQIIHNLAKRPHTELQDHNDLSTVFGQEGVIAVHYRRTVDALLQEDGLVE